MYNFDYSSLVNVFKEFIDDTPNNTSNRKVTILMHKNTDGDCIGSSLALCILLDLLGYECKIIASNSYNRNFNWMPCINNILVFNQLFRNTIINYIEKSDKIICIDFSQKSRIDQDLVSLLENKNVCIIDHHLDKPDIEGKNIINPTASSTCEIIFEILKNTYANKINENIATCLYAGIISDTGHFVTQNVTYRVYEIAAELVKNFDLKVHVINKNLFGNNRFARMRFLGHVLSRCLKIVPDYKVAYIVLTKEDTSKFYLKQGETDGLVNYALSIENIEFAALFNQKPDGVYISFRSIGDFSVSDFAKKYFNGGGHKNAAGGFSNCSIEDTLNNFINYLVNYDFLKFNN